MTSIKDYISLSETANSLKKSFLTPAEFKAFYDNVFNIERKSLILHFIVNNIPHAFNDRPILYEQITQYLANILQISPTEIKLIGSAKIGFSISPPPKYGRNFGEHSDLDFSIVNEDLFTVLENESKNWIELYKSENIKPNNLKEKGYWDDNLTSLPRKLKNGFVDTNLIPNREPFPKTRKINNSLWLIKEHIEKKHSFKVKKVSASIYKNWNSFTKRLYLNTESVMKELK